MININFLVGMPRAGNTILSSILNQNPNVKMSAHSILPTLLDSILQIKNHERFLNFPDSHGIDNIIENIFDNYYKHYDCENIIDRGAWGHYINIIDQMPIKGKKYIVLYRPILEVLASFVKVRKPQHINEFCDDLMMKDNIITEGLTAIRNIVTSEKDYLLITYDDLIKDFSKVLHKLCKYINVSYIEPDYKNIKQLEIKGIKYNDTFINGEFHTLDTGPVRKIETDLEEILPKEVIKKYKNFDINFNIKGQ